jgi:hypothetical protein
MKYLKKFQESNEINDVDFIIAKITDNFSKEEVMRKIEDADDETDRETALIDMIVWFEDKFKKDITNDDEVLMRLYQVYDVK